MNMLYGVICSLIIGIGNIILYLWVIFLNMRIKIIEKQIDKQGRGD